MTSFGCDTGELFKAPRHYIHYSKRGGRPQLMHDSQPRWVYLHMWGLEGIIWGWGGWSGERLNLVWLNSEWQNNKLLGSVKRQNQNAKGQKHRKLWEAARGMFPIVVVLCLKFMAIFVSWGDVRNELLHEVLLKGFSFDIRSERERERE